MPTHIFFQMGAYEDVAVTNEHAAAADERYMERSRTAGPYPLMLYTHNLHFLAVGRAAQGRYEEAKVAADRVAEFAALRVKEMQMAECWVALPLLIQVRFQRWDEILQAPAPDSAWLTVNALWHFARSLAFAGETRIVDANGERELFEAARRQLPARALYVNGNGRRAVELWRRAVAAQDALNYDEPPPWYYPIRESLGAALLRNGQAVEGEAVFREDLSRNRRNGRCLFGLMESLKAQDKLVDAEWVQKQQAAWRGAPLRVADLSVANYSPETLAF
jgi:hypothetical protein